MDKYRRRDRHPEPGDGHHVLPDPGFVEPVAHRSSRFWAANNGDSVRPSQTWRGTSSRRVESSGALESRMLYELQDDQIVPAVGSAGRLLKLAVQFCVDRRSPD